MDSQKADATVHSAGLVVQGGSSVKRADFDSSAVVKHAGFNDAELWAPAGSNPSGNNPAWQDLLDRIQAVPHVAMDVDRCAYIHLAGNPEWEALKATVEEMRAQMQQVRLVLAELAEALR